MNKKYLIEHKDCNYSSNGMEFSVKDAKEVEVLEKSKLYDAIADFDFSIVKTFIAYLKANKYLIVKIIE